MKIKFMNGLLIVDLLTVLLVLAIIFLPSNPARIVLGIPFLLFFPGYTLVMAIFPRKREMDSLELVAISVGMSIAVTALAGFALNFTPWGIRLEPVLYTIAGFIGIMSLAALIGRAVASRSGRLTLEFNIRLPGLEGGVFHRFLFFVLVVMVLGAAGVLGYIVSNPHAGEAFTEFYVLGQNGKAADYPTEIILDGKKVVGLKYGSSADVVFDEWARVSLGIVNHEPQKTEYVVKLRMDNRPVSFHYQGKVVDQLGPLSLQLGEKWEQAIGLAAEHPGDNQKIEFILYKNGSPDPENSLSLRVNVKPWN